MKKTMQKSVSVLLAICLVFSFTFVGNAQEPTAAEAVQTLEKDIPIIEIPGFGDEIYKGLSTPDESDDESIWSLDMNDVLSLVKKHLFSLIFAMIFRNTEKLSEIITDVLATVFGDAACDENGIPNPDTGIEPPDEIIAKDEYGQRNCYTFKYDWRLDMQTISTRLHEYILKVREVTGAEKVGLVSFSMGGSVMMTYLYEYYYKAAPAERDYINSAIFMCGAMNGVACCEDPFSGNIVLDGASLMRMLGETLGTNPDMTWLYKLLNVMYSYKLLDPIINYFNGYLVENLDDIGGNALISSLATIPGFYALMSYERYYDAEDFLFDTPEKKEKYAGLLEKNRYYHETVQKNIDIIVNELIEDEKNIAVISEYGYSMMPLTSDNTRMSDGTIATHSTSFGATCAPLGETLGKNYIQAQECDCGKSHVSPDNMIDASTCKYPEVTWFAKNIRHGSSDRFFADMVDLITYSDEQVTVWTYSDMPQFMVNYNNSCLVPLTD